MIGAEIIPVRNKNAIPVIPQLHQRISLYKKTDKYSDRGEQENPTENRIDTSDDLIDREYCRDQVVNKNNSIDHPCRYRSCLSVKSKHLCCRNISRRIDENRSYQKKQQTAENLIYRIYALIAVSADHIRHLCTAVTQTDHTGKIVVHRTADDISDRNCNKSDRPE